MAPSRTLDRIPSAAAARDVLNQVLSLSGLKVGDDGKVHHAARPRTDTEAHARATWLRVDYYDAVFESVKLLGDRLRQMTGLDLDGHKLVDATLAGAAPKVLLNEYVTVTERNEQTWRCFARPGAVQRDAQPTGA